MKLLQIIGLILAVAIAGCGSSDHQNANKVSTSGPLTVAEWKQMPTAEKYDERSFDRLKQTDPSLKDEAAWDQFMRDVVVPQRKKDIPLTPGQKNTGRLP